MFSRTDRAMEEFYDLCAKFNLEGKIDSLPNPSNFGSMRVMTFQNSGDDTIRVVQQTGQSCIIPAKGTAQIMLQPGEFLPTFERIE